MTASTGPITFPTFLSAAMAVNAGQRQSNLPAVLGAMTVLVASHNSQHKPRKTKLFVQRPGTEAAYQKPVKHAARIINRHHGAAMQADKVHAEKMQILALEDPDIESEECSENAEDACVASAVPFAELTQDLLPYLNPRQMKLLKQRLKNEKTKLDHARRVERDKGRRRNRYEKMITNVGLATIGAEAGSAKRIRTQDPESIKKTKQAPPGQNEEACVNEKRALQDVVQPDAFCRAISPPRTIPPVQSPWLQIEAISQASNALFAGAIKHGISKNPFIDCRNSQNDDPSSMVEMEALQAVDIQGSAQPCKPTWNWRIDPLEDESFDSSDENEFSIPQGLPPRTLQSPNMTICKRSDSSLSDDGSSNRSSSPQRQSGEILFDDSLFDVNISLRKSSTESASSNAVLEITQSPSILDSFETGDDSDDDEVDGNDLDGLDLEDDEVLSAQELRVISLAEAWEGKLHV